MFVRCPVLVGRRAQTDRFDALLQGAGRRRGGAVFVSGEAGIGKSRLVREFASTARASGLVDLAGRAVATGVPIPLRPFIEVALSVTRRGLLPERSALGPFAPSLGRVLPSWATERPVHDEATSAPVLGEALHSFFRLVAPDGCLLVLEDLHWADPESLAVVEYLCDHVEDSALVVVATLRTGEGPAAWAMADALVARGNAENMALARLDEDEVAAMVRACAPGVPPPGVDRAEGVPLFVEEMLGCGDAGELPRTVIESVRHRVALLDQRSRRVVAAAALPRRRVFEDR